MAVPTGEYIDVRANRWPGVIIDACRALRPLARRVDLTGNTSDELAELTAAIRSAQQSLDVILVEIAMVAEAQAQECRGRGAHATLLGDGAHVQGRTARCEARRSQLATEFSAIAGALRSGDVSTAHVDAIVRAVDSLDDEQRSRVDMDAIVAMARAQPIDLFCRTIRREIDRIRGDHGLGTTRNDQARSRWTHWFDDRTGMGHVHGEFDAERYESIVGSVEAKLTRLANDGGFTKNANLAATAAFNLLTGNGGRRSGTGRPLLSVLVDWKTLTEGPHPLTLSETAAGWPLPPASAARLACDAILQRLVIDEHGVPINVGRKHRTATDAQWQAAKAMYRTCVWQGCDQPLARCQLHHLHEWSDGGSTDLCNLVPVCGQHHHAVHEGGWSLKLHSVDRRLDIHSPDGRLEATTHPDRLLDQRRGPNVTVRDGPTHRSPRGRRTAQPAAP